MEPLRHTGNLTRVLGPVIVLMALLVAALPGSTVSASGQTIRVVQDQQHVRFPQSVDFQLTLEGDREIVDVRLHYRLTGSRVWSYTYAEFIPDRQVEARTQVSFRGGVYLPPQSEIEYFYSVRDADGNVSRTPRQTFFYSDDRFDWQTSEIGPLSLQWHDQSSRRVEAVVQEAGSAIMAVQGLLGVEVDRPLRGVIYNSFSEARQALPHLSATTTQGHVFQGFAFGEQGVFVGVGLEPGLIVHETAHLLVEQSLSRSWARVPSWVNEGFASYVEPGPGRSSGLGRREVESGSIPLRYMSTVSGKPDEIRLFYAKAEGVVGYLIESYGADPFREFIEMMGDGVDVERAMTQAYGFGVDDLEQQWLTTLTVLGQRDRTGGGGSPWVLLDAYLLGGLALLLLFAFLGRLAWRRVLRPASPVPIEEEPWLDDPYVDDTNDGPRIGT